MLILRVLTNMRIQCSVSIEEIGGFEVGQCWSQRLGLATYNGVVKHALVWCKEFAARTSKWAHEVIGS